MTPKRRRRFVAPAVVPSDSPPPRVSSAELIAWIEKYCLLSTPVVVPGQPPIIPMTIPPFMRHDLATIFDNPVRTRRAIISMGRKGAKTTTAAAIALAAVAGPLARRGGQVFSSGLSRDQAALIFSAAARFVRLNPYLSRVVKIKETAKEIVCAELGTRYRALSADASRNLGLDPSLIIHDELGAVEGPESSLFEALETASAAQRDPFSIIISTQAAADFDLLSTLIDDAQRGADPHVTCALYYCPDDVDPWSEEALRRANPAFDYWINRDELRAAQATAKRMPSREAAFRRFHLNQRVTASSPFIPPAVWNACKGRVAPLGELTAIRGGLDLASVDDMSALTLVGQSQTDGKFHVHVICWLPEAGLRQRAERDKTPYDAWLQQGFLRVTPGRTVDFDVIARDIRDIVQRHRVERLNFDPWFFQFLEPALRRASFSPHQIDELFVQFGQTTKEYSPVIATLERLLLDKKVVHDSPPLTTAVANLTTRTDAGGNRAPEKRKQRRRIDAAVAMLMAFGSVQAAPKKVDASVLVI